MKILLINSILFLTTVSCYSQNKFTLNTLFGTQTVLINGKEYFIDSIGIKIPTKYPEFDSLIFKRESDGYNFPIICNFKPDSNYTIIEACCGDLDLILSSKLDYDSLSYWRWPEDLDKLQGQLMDQPFISIRTKKYTKNNIYAWHADYVCKTEHKIIRRKLWPLGVPPKGAYWKNITTIEFFKTDYSLPGHKATELEEYLGINNIVELSSISFRLFDDERFVIIFDENNNIVKLEYE